jgi:hypothetical protein
MKTFRCVCGQLIFFQSILCVSCKRELGFFPDSLALGAIEPSGGDLFAPRSTRKLKGYYRKCQNYAQQSVCNWMIPESEKDEVFCKSCRLTETVPDLAQEQNRTLWALMESAKRRLIYSLLSLNLPVSSKLQDSERGLAFRFLSDTVNPDGSVAKVLTGHAHGIITLNIAEADDAVREKTRRSMNEPYRTLLGHFRHEVGHYYWDRLVCDTAFLGPFRVLFGDEQADYESTLKDYYAKGAPLDWQERCVSPYASSHPWEDWAETWAHFLHIQDTLEVAGDFGIRGKPLNEDSRRKAKQFQRAMPEAFDQMISSWLSLAVALNSINRSMGHQDLYPFVLTAPVIEKLRFVSAVISDAPSSTAMPADSPALAATLGEKAAARRASAF